MSFAERYKQQAKALTRLETFGKKRKVKWQSPSNIALIKYWGKRKNQIPMNPSLSFSLSNSISTTEITYEYCEKPESSIKFFFEGKPKPEFEERIHKHLGNLVEFLPFLNNLNLSIESSNSFPHSSGIASSASAMSAMALGLCSIANNLFGTLKDKNEFMQKASFLARLCSGSAARSVYGGFSIWGKSNFVLPSSNEVGCQIDIELHPSFQELNDSILITSPAKKKISSSRGHELMNDHPFAQARYNQARNNLNRLIKALQTGNEKDFVSILENEALSLHALMMASNPGFSLLNENTWNIIHSIRKFREVNGILMAFTLDAGPNVHLIYPEKNKNQILEFISKELIQYCHEQLWIEDRIGLGPLNLTQL